MEDFAEYIVDTYGRYPDGTKVTKGDRVHTDLGPGTVVGRYPVDSVLDLYQIELDAGGRVAYRGYNLDKLGPRD